MYILNLFLNLKKNCYKIKYPLLIHFKYYLSDYANNITLASLIDKGEWEQSSYKDIWPVNKYTVAGMPSLCLQKSLIQKRIFGQQLLSLSVMFLSADTITRGVFF